MKITINKNLLFLVICTFTLCNCANDVTLDELLKELEVEKIAMGTVSIFKNGKEIYNNSFGLANIEENKKANAETRYRIGSVSKTYTASIILQLLDEKKLTLETKLGTFFPGITNAGKISIENLLHHRSGIIDITKEPNFEVWISQPRDRRELLSKIAQKESDFEPSTITKYSNSNFILLSYIAEIIEEQSFEEVLKKRIFAPLKLRNTSFADTLNLSKNEAMCYYPENNEWHPITFHTNLTGTMGAGGIISTAREVAIFYDQLFTGKLLSESSLHKMTTPKEEMGMGVSISDYKDTKIYGHNGAIDGFRSMAIYVPKEELTIALTFNCSKVAMSKNIIRILEAYQFTYHHK